MGFFSWLFKKTEAAEDVQAQESITAGTEAAFQVEFLQCLRQTVNVDAQGNKMPFEQQFNLVQRCVQNKLRDNPSITEPQIAILMNRYFKRH